MKIYVNNLSYEITEQELREAFKVFGEVISVNIPRDSYSDRPRGYGFVEMSTKDEAQAAISGLNGKELKGRMINVTEAKPRREERQDGKSRS